MDAQQWNEIIARLPGAHVLQTWQWGQVKGAYGWQTAWKTWRAQNGQVEAAALVLERVVSPAWLPLPLRVLYVPRGPLLSWTDTDLAEKVITDLQAMARQRKAIFLKIDPEVALAAGIPGEDDVPDSAGAAVQAVLQRHGWRYSQEQVQFRNTVMIDLAGSEEDLLARMKQKTRYNIRLAERKGVTIRTGSEADLPLLYQMYAETSVRDGFVIRPQEYYLYVWKTFLQAGLAEPLLALVDGEPVAGLIQFRFAQRAWYLYGMSRQVHRERMPNYLLQWEAIRRAKAAGCTQYDLWGAPDVFDEQDSMWGVYRFKEGLGGQVLRTIGAWDYPVQPQLYAMYTRLLPRLLDVMRRRGKEKTRQEVSL